MEYTETIYVNANNGNDEHGDGSINSPFLTIEKAINNVKTVSPIIYLNKGVYSISILQNLSLTDKKITIKGKNLNTVIDVEKTAMTRYLGEMHIYNLIIKPNNSFSGDTRVISYSTDNYKVTFNNVLFKNNNNFPTNSWFYTATSGCSYYNKDFYNCTFIGSLSISKSGSANIYNCAVQHNDFGLTTVNENSVLNCKYDFIYNLINYDNNLYGVYSGSNSWITNKYLLKQNQNYYSIKSEFYSNGQFQPLNIDNPTDEDFTNKGFEDLQDLLVEKNTGNAIGIDKGNIGNGKYFSIDIPSDLISVNEVK